MYVLHSYVVPPPPGGALFLPVLSFVFCFQYFWIEVLILLPSRGWFSFQVHFFI